MQHIQTGGASQLDKITSLFTAIGDLLNASSWFPLLKWPFWTLTIILALCGVYYARFEHKKLLLTYAFQGALKLALIYMAAAACYAWAPSLVSDLSQLPFFSVSEEALTLVNPLGLLDRLTTALPRVVVRLYFLLFFINAVTVFDYTPKNFLSWTFFQGISGAASVVLYAAISAGANRFFRSYVDLFHKVLAVLILAFFLILLALKLYFSFIKPGGNPTFQPIFLFLTQKKFGSQFTVTALSFLIVICYLVIANLFGYARFELASFNTIAFVLSGLMCTGTLYIFSRFFKGT